MPWSGRAAAALDRRVVGVVLSGTRDDGSAGLAAIKAGGGATIVQDPKDAMYDGMPASAIANVTVDAIVPAALVGSTIAAMVNGEDLPPSARGGHPAEPELNPVWNPAGNPPDDPSRDPDPPEDEQVVARAGHRYSPDPLLGAQAEIARQALAGAPGTTLRRVSDTDQQEHGADAEEGAA
jgi:two-component system, chemotaxis family, protein-glutamate methylesterase/glutaminase